MAWFVNWRAIETAYEHLLQTAPASDGEQPLRHRGGRLRLAGAWVILDVVDHRWFGGNNVFFAIGLIAVGIGLMYLHDHRYDRLDHF